MNGVHLITMITNKITEMKNMLFIIVINAERQ
jgi:hypothetical protein